MADRSALHADCARCAGLCCVAPAFGRSAEFAHDKPAGVPCLHLAEDFGCSIHDRLRDVGYAGCTTYDCFGAGQQVVQHTFARRDWRSAPQSAPESAQQVFRVFGVMRGLHELLWYLLEARDLVASPAHGGPPTAGGADLAQALDRSIRQTQELTRAGAERLERFDVDRHREATVPLLRRASELARSTLPGPLPSHGGADLVGADLRGADLAGADLRGAVLLGADLRGADLHLADLTGADLRAADVRGTDLRTVLFATQPQVDAARGDRRTLLPSALTAPSHWSSGAPRINR